MGEEGLDLTDLFLGLVEALVEIAEGDADVAVVGLKVAEIVQEVAVGASVVVVRVLLGVEALLVVVRVGKLVYRVPEAHEPLLVARAVAEVLAPKRCGLVLRGAAVFHAP